MTGEHVRRGVGLLIAVLAGLYIWLVGIEKAKASLWTCAAGIVLMLA